MSEKDRKRCAKCNITAAEDSNIRFHRFPVPGKHGPLKARVWAMYCYPDGDWTNIKSLKDLHSQHKMLCSNHFDISAYTSSDRRRLNNFAIPTDAQELLIKLRQEECTSSSRTYHTNITVEKPQEMQSLNMQESAQILNTSPKPCLLTHPMRTPVKKRSKGILRELDFRKVIEMTPQKRKLYGRCRRNLREIIRLRNKIKKQPRDIIQALKENENVKKLISTNISSSFGLFLQGQLLNTMRKETGRRWTIDEKVMALSIYKKSTACYRLLRRLFCLPSEGTLKSLLNKIPLQCGVNSPIFETIKQITRNRKPEENICIMAFDEMSIKKNLTYNKKQDQIDGYQDHGNQGRTIEPATHALVFMAIGLRKRWKQPLAFFFSGNCVTADRLSVLIKEVLDESFKAGLIVSATVCDNFGVNIKALNSLGSSMTHPWFIYKGHEIVTILDPPHLLKCFRNNFLKYNIECVENVQIMGKPITGIAKWDHIKQFYDIDNENPNFVFAPALTKQHLDPNFKQKMKVSLASQVLSHSVASGMLAKIATNEIPREATTTAMIIEYMDKLFDSLNGTTPDLKRGKPFLRNLSRASPHLMFFKDIKKFFNDIKFVGIRSKPPSQEGFIRTLNAVERLFSNLECKFKIKSLSTRRLNQDPLENCFGCVRNNCGSNPNPNTVQFIAALKTAIIGNLLHTGRNKNCLDDKNSILDNLKSFLNVDYSESDTVKLLPVSSKESIELPIVNIEATVMLQHSGELQACAYVAAL